MQISIFAGALMLALASPLVVAESSSSQTSTYSTTKSVPAEPAYSSSRTEQQVDEHGNVVKKTQTYNTTDPATGNSSNSSSTVLSRPDGSQSSVEQTRERSNTDGGGTVTEKRTTTTSD